LEIALPEPSGEAETLSLGSFRNAWQLEPENLAALGRIVDWYNGLGPTDRARAPQPKTLIAVASRLPHTARELARIKGISERWCRQHGDAFIKVLRKAGTRREDDAPAEPPPYATWDEIRLEGWIAHMRAEVCARCLVAPELGFPQRIVRGVREIIRHTGDRREGARALKGWRKDLLSEAYGTFCDETQLR
jgi:ribonuclease D